MTTAREAVEALMDDACIVTFDVEGTGDDVTDPDTGVVGKPGGDSSNIYDHTTLGHLGRSLADADGTGGKCKVKIASETDIARLALEGGAQTPQAFYVLGLPWDAPEIPTGAVALMASARRDPLLVDKVLRIRAEASVGTFAVSRKYLCEVRP